LDRPDLFQDAVERHDAALQVFLRQQEEAVAAGHVYAALSTHPDPCFQALLKAAVNDRSTQQVLHDWLEEQAFPHAHELRSKRWNKGKWTRNQLLDLLSKPFNSTRRSFTGRTA
jgi:hypothetical protein